MLRPIKIDALDERVFAVSDLHAHHDRGFLYEPRGFKSIAEHDDALISRWNETCDERSQVFHLGDLLLNSDEAGFNTLMRRLRFNRLWLLWGNHNGPPKAAYRTALASQFPGAVAKTGEINYEVYPLTAHVDDNPGKMVIFLPQYAEIVVGRTNIVACHYAVESWNGMAKGSLMLHGHSHNGLDHVMPLRLDVGIEAFGRPVSLQEIKRLTANQSPAKVDHHG